MTFINKCDIDCIQYCTAVYTIKKKPNRKLLYGHQFYKIDRNSNIYIFD